MAKLFQIACLVLFLGMIYGWRSSYFIDDPFFSTSFDDRFDDDWFPSSKFDDIDELMEKSREEFRQMSNFSVPFFAGDNDQFMKTKEELDAVSPVCTTIENSPTTKAVELSNRRKIFRSTNTTTCVKELINGGMKYMYKEIKIIDDHNRTISQNNYYQSFTINDTTPSNTTV